MISYKVRDHAATCIHGFGASVGQQHLEPLLEVLRGRCREQCDFGAMPSEIVLIDLDGIEAATASYLKALVIPILIGDNGAIKGTVTCADELSATGINIYPMVSGLSPDVREELQDVLCLRNLPCLEALEWSPDAILRARVLGFLDQILKHTYLMLQREGRASAAELHAKYQSEGITTTGWNNRLADLHRLRLASRTKSGRQWIYEPIAAEVLYG